MHIIEVTWRHRNDFRFVAICRWCGERSRWGDGYADAYYQQVVFPHRHCPHCGKDERERTRERDAAKDAVIEAARSVYASNTRRESLDAAVVSDHRLRRLQEAIAALDEADPT